MLQTLKMKIEKSFYINPFGGINYVLNYFNQIKFDRLLEDHLPELAAQSQYSWKDLIYSLFSIYYCGGDCIEDIGGNFKNSLLNNPLVKVPSPDTILTRLKELTVPNIVDKSPQGKDQHAFSINPSLAKLNIELLAKMGCFNSDEILIDYDNTIIYTEKSDTKMTYKKQYGYQPGVAILNNNFTLYVENRNGNNMAKTLQDQTLSRMFDYIDSNIKNKKLIFRADSASYAFEVIKLLKAKKAVFYIGAPSQRLYKAFATIDSWSPSKDKKGENILIGQTIYTPFQEHLKKSEQSVKDNQYRLIVKKKQKVDKQGNLLTGDSYDYSAIITNDTTKPIQQIIDIYYHRGAVEKEFDILKNDFAWNSLPFSRLEQNTVFLCFMAMCRNLYYFMLNEFSEIFPQLKPSFRIKKFIFRFIAVPGKWIRRARTHILKLYCEPNAPPII